MGKTGSIKWVKVKGRNGNTIKVPESKANKTHTGPAQRFASDGTKRRFKHRSPKSIVK